MDKLTEIKEELNSINQEYKKNKSQLNAEKTKMAARLIVEMTLSDEASSTDAASELSRFSADIVNKYFESVTKSSAIPLEKVDDVLKEFLLSNTDVKKSQYYVKKFLFAVTSVMNNYRELALNSRQLPLLTAFIADFAVKSDTHMKHFQSLIINTAGRIFMLDYSEAAKKSLVNIWNASNSAFPDLSKTKYESLVLEWGIKYGFVKGSISETPVKQNNSNSADAEKSASSEESANNLYVNIKNDIDKGQESIIKTLTDMIAPVSKALESVQSEIGKIRENGVENVSLKVRNAELERQLNEQKAEIQSIKQSLTAANAENDELKIKISSLESLNAELDSKLNDAYAINSLKSSEEVEKVRMNLKKEFEYLYEDWLEYEFSDVSEENYESLQAIIKKMFRSLERNGINFKENDE